MLLSARLTLGQLSVAHNDATVDHLHADNRFFARVTPGADEAAGMAALNASDTPADGQKPTCPLDIQLAWSAKLGASVYSTPVIAQAGVGRTVLSSTFVRYIEAVSGADGHELPGWPYAFSRSSFHSSPLLLDVDRDGTDDLLLVSYDAELIVLGTDGLPRRGWSSRLPKLRVKKRWFEGLHDVHTTPREHQGLVHHDDDSPEAEGADGDGDGDGDGDEEGGVPTADGFAADVGAHGALTPEAEASFSLFAADAADDDALSGGEAMEEAAEEEPRLRRWVELYEAEEMVKRADEQGQVLVDAHVLATPTLADVDGDGELDLVLAVSYFIEEESAARLARHGVVLDRGKYVAGGVVVVDPRSGAVKWSVHLDLTTDETKLRAYIYSSPAVADLDGDGTMEIAVGTSMGFVYVLAGKDGRLREGFPVQMNEIQAALVTADVDGDGFLEILAADAVGSVAAWGHRGASLWEVQTSGLCAQGLTLASLRGDGALQVVVPTTAGLVHVLDGKTGREAHPFPVRTEGQILAAALVLPLLTSRNTLEPHLVVSSFDGFVYVVNARSGCAHRIDVGEHAYTQVRAAWVLSCGCAMAMLCYGSTVATLWLCWWLFCGHALAMLWLYLLWRRCWPTTSRATASSTCCLAR